MGGEGVVDPEFRVLQSDILSAALADPSQIEEAYRTAIRRAQMTACTWWNWRALTSLVPVLRGRGEDEAINRLRAVLHLIRDGEQKLDVEDTHQVLD